MGNMGQWGTLVWAMGQMGNGAQGAIGYRGYGVQSIWATLDLCIIKEHTDICYMSHVPLDSHLDAKPPPPSCDEFEVVPSNVSKCQKMSSCQKDVECQKIKHLDYGGGSQKNKLIQ